uniref:Tyrosine 3-monooxygenase-like n=1 Tax=Sinocyclocheilus grahami TaxID=75366 RepID=A0A672KG21_SINGR
MLYDNIPIYTCILTFICFEVGSLFTFLFTKIHHLETRPSRKPKDGLEDLEYYVQCKVHLSDVSTLVSSLKRSAEDVKTTKEVKFHWFPRKIAELDKCHHLINKFDPDLDQDHPVSVGLVLLYF